MVMKGRKEHANRLKRLSGAEVVRLAGRVVYVGADMIRAHAFREISRGSISGKGHIVSKPGEYPNRDSGGLQGGFEIKQTGPVEAEFSSNAPYAGAAEFKPESRGGRPHVRRSRDAVEPEINRLFVTEIGKLVKRSGR